MQRILVTHARSCRLSNPQKEALLQLRYRSQSFQEQDFTWDEENPRPLSEEKRDTLLRKMIRANILSEVAASRLATGQRCTEQTRPDFAMRQQREAELLKRVEDLAPSYRARPSLLRPVLAAVGLTLGAASSVLPKQASAAISGGVQEALTEQYNDQLRELREAGLTEDAAELREVVRELRDEERAPLDAMQAPDLMKMQRPQELAPEEVLAGAVKYSLRGLLSLGSRI